jgi:hypothetical protein
MKCIEVCDYAWFFPKLGNAIEQSKREKSAEFANLLGCGSQRKKFERNKSRGRIWTFICVKAYLFGFVK